MLCWFDMHGTDCLSSRDQLGALLYPDTLTLLPCVHKPAASSTSSFAPRHRASLRIASLECKRGMCWWWQCRAARFKRIAWQAACRKPGQALMQSKCTRACPETIAGMQWKAGIGLARCNEHRGDRCARTAAHRPAAQQRWLHYSTLSGAYGCAASSVLILLSACIDVFAVDMPVQAGASCVCCTDTDAREWKAVAPYAY